MRKRRADTTAVKPQGGSPLAWSPLAQALLALWIAAITLLHYGQALNAFLEHLPRR